MLLGLSKIIDSPGASVTFSTTVDLSDLCYGVSYPVSGAGCGGRHGAEHRGRSS